MATDMPDNLVPASNFILTVNANVDNEKLSDAQFRQFIRNSLPIVKEVVEHEDRTGRMAEIVFEDGQAGNKEKQ